MKGGDSVDPSSEIHIEVEAGHAILGAPTVGKTTLAKDHPQLEVLDQDEVKIDLAGQVNPFPFQKRNQMWTVLATTLAECGVVTYSDFDLESDTSVDARYVKDNTVIAFHRDNEEMKQIMIARDGSAHPDCLTWKFDWYKKIAPVIVKLKKGTFIGAFLTLTPSIKPKHKPRKERTI